ncbi:MAG: hypothetical protein L0332_19080 [Chloroflexi bacterium]|nr:hypothetical protein [Chloroflexota bacterium]MCI0576294.1 hypothetical protein [Chloroflexota bacterium]MCI0644510.1 hypothetical protein [Chloroflexota bacterium]MCI0728801.1 hypothetical protein [Chloroflexota bacterium]
MLLLGLGLASLLAGCVGGGAAAGTATATAGPVASLATVESIEIIVQETFPVQVSVVARGMWPNSCTTIDRVEQRRTQAIFRVTLATLERHDVACPETPVPFEESVALDVLGLPAGIYIVEVNNVEDTFTLQKDNVPDVGNAVISGRIWHDLCAVSGEGGVEASPSPGCRPADGGGYQANGVLQPGEPGLGGIIVTLGPGMCPASGLAVTVTDGDGFYLFGGLKAGAYCVMIDPAQEQNASLLVPGQWTYSPDPGGWANLTLIPGENKADVNFGWDYQFLPVPESGEPGCTDAGTFVADLSVPDDTVVAPGQVFTKTWQLRNDGGCTWGPGYSLVFIGGEPMGGLETQPLAGVTAPGEILELSVTLVAPLEPGSYRSEWKLGNARGILFGLGPEGNEPFWVQIVVSNPTS